jgi:hypothetical protein
MNDDEKHANKTRMQVSDAGDDDGGVAPELILFTCRPTPSRAWSLTSSFWFVVDLGWSSDTSLIPACSASSTFLRDGCATVLR